MLKFIITGLLHRCGLTSSPTFFLYGLGNLDKTMGDNNNDRGDPAVATFPVVMYTILNSYLALVPVPYGELLDMLSLLHVVKSSSA
jgi:hypothetical protein